MFTFNSNEIWVNYIKQILKTFNLPQCRVFENKAELLEFYRNSAGIDSLNIIKNFGESTPCIVRYNKGALSNVCSYIEGSPYLNLTKTLRLTNNYYDSYTHEYLGNYLRFLRDFYNLNLMSMYNCYSNNFIEKGNYKYVLIPARFNQKYTLAITGSNIEYAFTYKTNIEDLQELFSKTAPDSGVYKLKGSKFKAPTVLSAPSASREQQSSTQYSYSYFNEKSLCLVLKLPKAFKNKIVVLEGDYSKNQNKCSSIIINHDKAEKIIINNKEVSLNKAYDSVNIEPIINTNVDLLSSDLLDKTTQIAFSDRLFEYLIGNAMTSRYSVSGSVVELKEKIGLDSTSKITNYDRLYILEKAQLNKKDLKGFIDKDMEVNL